VNRLLLRLRSVLAGEPEPELTGRLFRTVCLLATALALLVIEPVNLLQSVPVYVHAATVAFGTIGILLCREALRGRYHYRTFFALVLLTFNWTWFLDAGADGSIALVLFAGAFYAVLFFTGKERILALALFFADGFALYLLGFLRPQWVTGFASPEGLLLDRLIGFGIGNLLLTSTAWIVLSGYHRERARLSLTVADLEKALAEVKTLRSLLPLCAWCRRIRSDDGLWLQVDRYLTEHTDMKFSHGICPECAVRFNEEIDRSIASQPGKK
jgi:hypothetical protein